MRTENDNHATATEREVLAVTNAVAQRPRSEAYGRYAQIDAPSRTPLASTPAGSFDAPKWVDTGDAQITFRGPLATHQTTSVVPLLRNHHMCST